MVDRVVLECREGLETLFRGVEGIDEVIVRGNRLPATVGAVGPHR